MFPIAHNSILGLFTEVMNEVNAKVNALQLFKKSIYFIK